MYQLKFHQDTRVEVQNLTAAQRLAYFTTDSGFGIRIGRVRRGTKPENHANINKHGRVLYRAKVTWNVDEAP